MIAPAVTSGALLLGVDLGGRRARAARGWCAGARSPSDVVAASAWSAGTAASAIALGEGLGGRVGQAAPHGLAPGAVVAAALAVALAHARRGERSGGRRTRILEREPPYLSTHAIG